MAELQDAIKHLRTGKSADGDGLVLEMINHSSLSLHEELLDAYNKMLATGRYEPSWYHTDFTMITKKGDLSDVKNCRPIALLKITYNIFPQCCIHVCDRFWTANNQQINLAFDPNTVQITPSRFHRNTFSCFPRFLKTKQGVFWQCYNPHNTWCPTRRHSEPFAL